MAKRFTDTDLWKTQRWFRKLTPAYKLAFCYIKDTCNHAGLWKVDCSDLIEDLGFDEFDFNEFVDTVNIEFDKISGKKIVKERLRIVKNNLWITGFIQFQYEGKDKAVSLSSPVRTALLILQSIDLLQFSIDKGYITLKEPLQEGWQAPKDKDRDKDKNSNTLNGNFKKIKAVYFKDNFAIFPDESKIELSERQISLLKNKQLKPTDISKAV